MQFFEKDIINIRTIISKRQQKFENTNINYFHGESPFGNFLSAFYHDELCYLAFYDVDFQHCLEQLQKLYPKAKLYYDCNFQHSDKLKLLLKGTEFDIKVWNELLKISKGKTVSYNDIATAIGNPKSVRAVGNAVGRNNIAYIVPCHRVIQKTGGLGGFASGTHRKLKMLSYEGVKI